MTTISGPLGVAATSVQSSPADSASGQKESNEVYFPNIAYLPLKDAQSILGYSEQRHSNHCYDNRDIHGNYGDQRISDIDTYLAALKDHIAKLENGASPLSVSAKTGDMVVNLSTNARARLKNGASPLTASAKTGDVAFNRSTKAIARLKNGVSPLTASAKTGDVVVNLSTEARARLNVALAKEGKNITSPSGTDGESAISAETPSTPATDSAEITAADTDTLTGMAVKPSAENLFDVVVKLSPHMALVVEAGSWLSSNMEAIRAKANVEIAKLEQGIDSTADSATKYAMFDNAGAEGRDAYVQRELVLYDASQAAGALYRQYKYALEHDVSPAMVDPAVVPGELDNTVLKRPDAVAYIAHEALQRQAMAWFKNNMSVINEKASVEAAKWEPGILTDDIHDPTTAYTKFGKASAGEKEAYVQRELIRYDVSRATYALYQQYQYAMDRNLSPSAVDPSVIPEDSIFKAVNGGTREQKEFMLRQSVEVFSAGPITHNPADVARAITVAAVAVSQTARKLITEQDVIDANHAHLLTLRQKMESAGDTAFYQATYTNKGQLSAEMPTFIKENGGSLW